MIKVFSKVLGGTFKEPAGPTQKGSDWPKIKKGSDRQKKNRIGPKSKRIGLEKNQKRIGLAKNQERIGQAEQESYRPKTDHTGPKRI